MLYRDWDTYLENLEELLLLKDGVFQVDCDLFVLLLLAGSHVASVIAVTARHEPFFAHAKRPLFVTIWVRIELTLHEDLTILV